MSGELGSKSESLASHSAFFHLPPGRQPLLPRELSAAPSPSLTLWNSDVWVTALTLHWGRTDGAHGGSQSAAAGDSGVGPSFLSWPGELASVVFWLYVTLV